MVEPITQIGCCLAAIGYAGFRSYIAYKNYTRRGRTDARAVGAGVGAVRAAGALASIADADIDFDLDVVPDFNPPDPNLLPQAPDLPPSMGVLLDFLESPLKKCIQDAQSRRAICMACMFSALIGMITYLIQTQARLLMWLSIFLAAISILLVCASKLEVQPVRCLFSCDFWCQWLCYRLATSLASIIMCLITVRWSLETKPWRLLRPDLHEGQLWRFPLYMTSVFFVVFNLCATCMLLNHWLYRPGTSLDASSEQFIKHRKEWILTSALCCLLAVILDVLLLFEGREETNFVDDLRHDGKSCMSKTGDNCTRPRFVETLCHFTMLPGRDRGQIIHATSCNPLPCINWKRIEEMVDSTELTCKKENGQDFACLFQGCGNCSCGDDQFDRLADEEFWYYSWLSLQLTLSFALLLVFAYFYCCSSADGPPTGAGPHQRPFPSSDTGTSPPSDSIDSMNANHSFGEVCVEDKFGTEATVFVGPNAKVKDVIERVMEATATEPKRTTPYNALRTPVDGMKFLRNKAVDFSGLPEMKPDDPIGDKRRFIVVGPAFIQAPVLKMQILSAHDLKDKRGTGTYAKAYLNGNHLDTTPAVGNTNRLNPVWDTSDSIEKQVSGRSTVNLKLEVWNKNRVTDDSALGHANIQLDVSKPQHDWEEQTLSLQGRDVKGEIKFKWKLLPELSRVR